MKRIGMLTSGGDCQALNAAMRGVVKCLSCSGEDVEIYGFLEGYRGLIYGNFRMLTGADFSGILTKGGTILGSSRTPFKTIQDPDENGLNKVEVKEATIGSIVARMPALLASTVRRPRVYARKGTTAVTNAVRTHKKISMVIFPAAANFEIISAGRQIRREPHAANRNVYAVTV